MSAATETVFRLQELCDLIVYHIALQSSSQDHLKSAALVCQTLCISAQSQIFRHVILDPYRPDCAHFGEESPTEAVTSVFHRLSAVLTASPHLLRHIRCLSVLARSKILILVSGIRFPLLGTIRFNFRDLLRPGPDLLGRVRDLIGSTSVREVELCGLHGNFFASPFETSTPHLDSLSRYPVESRGHLVDIPLPRLFLFVVWQYSNFISKISELPGGNLRPISHSSDLGSTALHLGVIRYIVGSNPRESSQAPASSRGLVDIRAMDSGMGYMRKR
ncbi:hypothetical protein B0H10DRAFT_1975317 [Mycena sp. CBHHK59/15]|nr:hypothetical protein B0H10DRAFT_1975317 [Mycena sp. CBHHK59/15]